MFGRKKKDEGGLEGPASRTASSEDTLNDNVVLGQPTKTQIKRATRTRFYWALASAFCLLMSVVFVILVEIGSTYTEPALTRIYFLRINVANIIPVSVPDAVLINSIAQSLGLHDFYQVGLWGFCEGYNGRGVTHCSNPQVEYWFNPVAIIKSQLLAGATIALPIQINNILDVIKVVSHVMFGLFLTAACLNFVLIFIVPLAIYSRWVNFPITIFVFLGALCMTGASVIATVMFVIFRNAITTATELNIKANIGNEMFAFMWIASAFSIFAWLIQMGMCCCCASRRDVRTGRKTGRKSAWQTDGVADAEKPKRQRRLPTFLSYR